ncbi:MAG: hypothetical protein GXP14_03005 [Gammaproteobacteria bacterium]|nr:hypothetical protein [Gammaproteobacteria bacterium]
MPRCFFCSVLILSTALILSACGGGGGGLPQEKPSDINNPANPTFKIGGIIRGLSGSLTLQNNGGDDLSTNENDSFTFTVSLSPGSAYSVSIASAPENQTCTISNENGTVDATDVANIVINCENISDDNIQPSADAGSNFSVFENDPASLVGNGTDPDGTIKDYFWLQTAGPKVKLTPPGAAISTFTAPAVSQITDLLFQLTVTDNEGASSSATVTITVQPKPENAPQVNAGPTQTVDEETTVTLLGNSSDLDGTVVSSTWSQIAGSNIVITDETALSTTFTAPTVTEIMNLVFELTVTDNDGLAANDFVTIIVQPVNIPPIVNAGNEQSVNEKTTVTLTGSADDSDGTITAYSWKQTTGIPIVSLIDANSVSATFTAPSVTKNTAFIFELTVSDNEEAKATASVIITVKPNLTVNAGLDERVIEETTTTLTGSASDNDGNITSYLWRQITGPTVTLTDANNVSTSFTAPDVDQDTALTFELTATDNESNTASDTVIITITNAANNSPPAIKERDDIRTQEQKQVTLTSTINENGEQIRYQWQQKEGPSVLLNEANSANTSFTAPDVDRSTVLEFTVTATDRDSDTIIGIEAINVIVFDSATQFEVSGNVTFELVPQGNSGLDYSASMPAPVRGAIVEAINNESKTVEASTTTNAEGNYLLNLSINKDYVIRVKAQLKQAGTPQWDFSVVDNTSSNALYALVGSAFNVGVNDSTRDMHAPSGWNGSSYSETRAAAPFAILDAVYNAYNKVLAAKSNTSFPPLKIKWSVKNVTASGNPDNGQIGTSYYDGDSIYLLGAADNDTDEYDRHVVIHEWMHYYMAQFSRDDSMGGNHGGEDRLDIRIAYSEGLANAFSAMVTDQPLYSDSLGARQSTRFTIDVENETVSNPGWYNEHSIALTLYDVYDNNNEGKDTLSLGFTAINDVLTTTMRTTPVTSIFPFLTALRSNNTASATALDALFIAQSINSNSRIDQYGTNETNYPESPANILPIFTPLIIGDPAINICSIADYGTYNKLSNRRFIRFNVSTSGIYQITASNSSNSDPDLILHDNSGIVSKSEGTGNSETFSSTLSVGDYVLEIYEYSNLDPNSPRGTTCFNISIN